MDGTSGFSVSNRPSTRFPVLADCSGGISNVTPTSSCLIQNFEIHEHSLLQSHSQASQAEMDGTSRLGVSNRSSTLFPGVVGLWWWHINGGACTFCSVHNSGNWARFCLQRHNYRSYGRMDGTSGFCVSNRSSTRSLGLADRSGGISKVVPTCSRWIQNFKIPVHSLLQSHNLASQAEMKCTSRFRVLTRSSTLFPVLADCSDGVRDADFVFLCPSQFRNLDTFLPTAARREVIWQNGWYQRILRVG